MSYDRKRNIRVFPSQQALADAAAEDFQIAACQAHAAGENFSAALSGGNTPKILFERLALPEVSVSIPWDIAHLFWGDERCVPPDHLHSNFAMTRRTLL